MNGIVSGHSNARGTNALYIRASVCMHNAFTHHKSYTHILVCLCLNLCTSTNEKRDDLGMALLCCHMKRGPLYMKQLRRCIQYMGRLVYMLSMKEEKDAKMAITTPLRLCHNVPCRFMRGLHDIGCLARN